MERATLLCVVLLAAICALITVSGPMLPPVVCTGGCNSGSTSTRSIHSVGCPSGMKTNLKTRSPVSMACESSSDGSNAAPRCPRGSTPWPLRPTRRCGYRVGRCPGRTFCSNPRRLGICCRRGTRPPRPLPICREPHGRCRSLNECNSDRDCPRNKRCCTSRCGHKCELRRPVRIS